MVEYNPFDHRIVEDVYDVYRRLRNQAPVYYNSEIDFYALSRFDDVMSAHLDPVTFSSAHGVTIEGIDAGQPFLIVKDPPEHTWHRKIVSRVFTPRRIGGLEAFIRETAVTLLDEHVGSEGFDAVSQFSFRLPLDVIGALIDIPAELREEVHEKSDVLNARDGTSVAPDAAVQASAALVGLFATLVAERRKRPGDDVISMLMASEVQDDEGRTRMLDDQELAFRFLELAFAGHETVAKLIANGIVALAWYPDARRELAADPGLIPGAVEEMLRWDPPSQYQGRWTTRPVELHGTTIPQDKRVVLLTGSATHDERRFENPEMFDIHRKIERHVSFGFGIHLCLGAALARLELRVAFEEFLKRFPEYDIAPSGVVRQYGGNVRGLQNLPIVGLRAAASA
ncbi:MAG: cytochrome P450 [Actinomycetota bacterium]|nr:cytochrome P450 [Actinomycetota bacterium]